MPATAQLGRDIGQTENALRAILVSILENTVLSSYSQYVGMALVAAETSGVERQQVERQLASAAKISATEATSVVEDLIAVGLIDSGAGNPGVLSLSAPGASMLQTLREEISAVNERVYAGIPGHDLDVTKQTLAVIHERANSELARRTG